MVKRAESRAGRKRVVVKVTGSLFDDLGPAGVQRIAELASVIREFASREEVQVSVIVGGGAVSRSYVESLRTLGVSETFQDEVGILATRLNAAIMLAAIGEVAFPRVLSSVDEFRFLARTEKVLVGGGLHPGFSTVACAALIAEIVGADLLVIMSKGGGVYNKDPAIHADARLLKEVRGEELLEIVLKSGWQRAGRYPLFDLTAINIILRSKIPTVVIPPEAGALTKALRGEEVGSRISV